MLPIASSATGGPDARRLFRSARPASPQSGRRLSAQQERELAARILAGDRAARDELVVGNIGLAYYVARRYLGWGFHDLSLDDLGQEGSLGLLVAAERYDPATHGTRFSTYAWFWVRQQIRRAIMNTGEPIRLPAHIHARGEGESHRVRVHRCAVIDRVVGARDQYDPALDLSEVCSSLTVDQRELLRWYAVEYGTRGPKSMPRNSRLNRYNAARKLIDKLRLRFKKEGPADG